MNMQEIKATLKAIEILQHLKGHFEDMAEKETGRTQELLQCANKSVELACQALNGAVVLALTDGGDQA